MLHESAARHNVAWIKPFLCIPLCNKIFEITYEELHESISKRAEIVKRMSALAQQADVMLYG